MMKLDCLRPQEFLQAHGFVALGHAKRVQELGLKIGLQVSSIKPKPFTPVRP